MKCCSCVHVIKNCYESFGAIVKKCLVWLDWHSNWNCAKKCSHRSRCCTWLRYTASAWCLKVKLSFAHIVKFSPFSKPHLYGFHMHFFVLQPALFVSFNVFFCVRAYKNMQLCIQVLSTILNEKSYVELGQWLPPITLDPGEIEAWKFDQR